MTNSSTDLSGDNLEPSRLSNGPCLNEGSSTSTGNDSCQSNPSNQPSTASDTKSTGFGHRCPSGNIDDLFAELISYEKMREEKAFPQSSTRKYRTKPENNLFDMRIKKGRAKFASWLKNIPDADYFLKHEQRMVFLLKISRKCRKLVKQWIRRIDPVGASWLNKQLASISQKRLTKKQTELTEIIGKEQKDMIMMEREVMNSPGLSIVQIVPKTGIQKIVASLVIAGESREEIAAIVQMKVADVNSMIEGLDLHNAQSIMNDAIQAMANGMVARDLAKKEITEQTIEANKIAVSRRKLQLEESAEVRELRKEQTHVNEIKAVEAESRFMSVEEVKE